MWSMSRWTSWSISRSTWWPAGPSWKPFVRTERVEAITAATIASPDQMTLAMRWAEITQVPYDLDDQNRPILEFENAVIRFVPETDGRGERLIGVDLRCADQDAVVRSADRLGCLTDTGTITAAGLEITCV